MTSVVDWVSSYGEQDECAPVKETRNVVKTETSEGEFDDDCMSSNISQVNTEPEETESQSENTEVDNSKDNSVDGISQLVANIDGTETASTKADKQPTCEICGKTFRHPSALRGHMFMHTGERPYRCSKCGLTFTFISNLSRHKTIHTGAKSYACTLCGKAFQRRDTQRRHEKVAHSDEKPHTCPQCGKAFKLKNDIVMHMRTHLDDKPFVCEICGKTFSRMPYLVTHRCTHTDARPFQCPNCPKKFKDKSGVTRHQLTHSKLKWHMCPTCGKMFRSKVQFIEHEYCHNGIQRPPPRYQCLVCGKAFTNNSHLKRHTRNIHERAKSCRSVPPIKQDVLDDQTLTLQSWEEKH
ncbi:hypothetical protein LSAT2_004015 [Lamellibrachia satsuma]|nr:hypothetical protein LSAT2_004015 [Lamellibrachia satsuma]